MIIEKSAYLINRNGMAGTSISAIMQATGLAKGGIYGNFLDKNEICRATFLYLVSDLSSKLTKLINSCNSAEFKFYSLLDFYENQMLDIGGCPIMNFGLEADDTNAEIAKIVGRSIVTFQKRIADIILFGQNNGELSQGVDAYKHAVKVFCLLEGGILCSKVLKSRAQLQLIIGMIKDEFRQLLN
ncbi:hypothetical protein D9M68_720100 [compost metagenome]